MIEDIFNITNLQRALKEIKESRGIDNFSLKEFSEYHLKELHKDLINGSFTPEPMKKIDFKKDDKIRPISIPSIKDKIVQRVLLDYLNSLYNSTFSDKSYAYRPNKSTLKAINRVSDFIKRGNVYVLKSDIKNFFETIDHHILVCMLKEKIKDKRIIDLILMYLKIGAFDKNLKYVSHNLGVYQGNIISTILSNIYLDKMDKFLERHNFDFVRFADDFVIFSKNKFRIELVLRNLRRFLKLLKLSLKEEKTYITHINSDFSFLGVYFRGHFRTIDRDRLEKIDKKLFSYTKYDFKEFIEKMNTYYRTIENYYLKIITPTSNEYNMLKNMIIGVISEAVFLHKKNKKITKKSDFKELISKIDFLNLFYHKDKTIDLIISKAYNRLESVEKKIEKKRRNYEKKFALEGIIHIFRPGLSIGLSKNKFTLKDKGKIIKYFPKNKVKRILIEGQNVAISTNIIKETSKLNIHIDFIDKRANPYANIIFYNSSTSQLIHKQALILNTPKQLELAKAFVIGKLKNQRNYLRYLNKYYKSFDREVEIIDEIIKKSNKAKNIDSLRGFEGSGAVNYWKCLGKIAGVEGFERVTYRAKDLVNSSLNYAYAILYGKVQYALVLAGLSLHISFLHALDNKKPTLVFDMIEEFRPYIVDRAIFSMLSKNEKLEIKNGLLTKATKEKIAKEIYERLATYTTYRKKSMKMENIIISQAYELKNAILEDKKYKPFIGRF